MTTRDPLGRRLLATFLAELQEQLRVMNADLLALEAAPDDAERLKSLFRVAHTLKGAARAAQVPLVSEVCHALETLLARARDGRAPLAGPEVNLLFSAADALARAGERLAGGSEVNEPALVEVLRALGGAAERASAGAATASGPASGGAAPKPAGAPAVTPARSPGRRRDSGPAVAIPETRVRVEAEQLDGLLASTGQLVIATGRLAPLPSEMEALSDLAGRCAADWRRAGRRIRLALERAGPAGARSQELLDRLDRSLRQLAAECGRVAAEAAHRARTLAQATDETADRVRRLRMRPFADVSEALPRAVRDLAAAAGKEVRLQLAGGEVQADRAVLDGLREAILQLVRNAVDHGIEPPEVRERLGKPRAGTLAVEAELRGNRIVVRVSDDGAGLDLDGIREQLRRRGLPAPADERELAQALLQGGVSTRSEATPISGRGVGLDVVRAAVTRINGAVAVSWTPGAGTTFRLECPPSLATLRALVVEVGPYLAAIPAAAVLRALRVPVDRIRRAAERDMLPTEDGAVPLVPLARLLPPLPERPVPGAALVVLLEAADRRLAVAVDALVGEQELVIRPIAGRNGGAALLAGAALLPTGRVALVVNPGPLVATGHGLPAGGRIVVAPEAQALPPRRRILVVDDSITARTLEQSVLEAAGYEVRTAVDGADAWRVLQEHGADLVVSDIEMPRLDGFGLCQAIRASPRFRDLPIILVTALESPEHRARGLEVGATAYLGKSSFDQVGLLDTVRELLG